MSSSQQIIDNQIQQQQQEGGGEQISPQQLLFRIIVSNQTNLNRLLNIMEQQTIYINTLLFPSGTNTNESNPSGQTTPTTTSIPGSGTAESTTTTSEQSEINE